MFAGNMMEIVFACWRYAEDVLSKCSGGFFSLEREKWRVFLKSFGLFGNLEVILLDITSNSEGPVILVMVIKSLRRSVALAEFIQKTN